MTFTKKDYLHLINEIVKIGLPIQPLGECYRTDHMNVVSIRHDVDDNLPASVKMAELEESLSIVSTYFILNTAPYWGNLGGLKHITRYHEIGWHNNAVAASRSTNYNLAHCISEPLKTLRRFAPVVGTASHGDQICHDMGFLNYYAFKECEPHKDFPNMLNERYSLHQFGLLYEAYHTGHTHYISDSGDVWQQDNAAVIADVKAKKAEGIPVKLQVLVHPQWWSL